MNRRRWRKRRKEKNGPFHVSRREGAQLRQRAAATDSMPIVDPRKRGSKRPLSWLENAAARVVKYGVLFFFLQELGGFASLVQEN